MLNNDIDPILVSVIVPTFNSSKYLVETTNSIIAQSYQYWEALFVDDGSSDDTVKILKEFAGQEKRIKYLNRKKNKIKGANACRNTGLENAGGKFVMFLDSDDLLTPFCIQQRVDSVVENPGLDFYVFKMMIFYKVKGDSTALAVDFNITDPLTGFLSNKTPYPWAISCPLWRKSFLLNIGGFNENYPRLQDPELHTRVFLMDNVKYKMIREKDFDCYYRVLHKNESKKFLSGLKMYVHDFAPIVRDYDSRNKTQYILVFRALFSNIFLNVDVQYSLFPFLIPVLSAGMKCNVISRLFAILFYVRFFIKASRNLAAKVVKGILGINPKLLDA